MTFVLYYYVVYSNHDVGKKNVLTLSVYTQKRKLLGLDKTVR